MIKLWPVLILLALAPVACDGSLQEVSAQDEQLAELSPSLEEEWDETQHDSLVESIEEPQFASEGCECGNFMDDDGDGVCDLATSGECRRARTGRCPCGS